MPHSPSLAARCEEASVPIHHPTFVIRSLPSVHLSPLSSQSPSMRRASPTRSPTSPSRSAASSKRSGESPAWRRCRTRRRSGRGNQWRTSLRSKRRTFETKKRRGWEGHRVCCCCAAVLLCCCACVCVVSCSEVVWSRTVLYVTLRWLHSPATSVIVLISVSAPSIPTLISL